MHVLSSAGGELSVIDNSDMEQNKQWLALYNSHKRILVSEHVQRLSRSVLSVIYS